MTRTKRLRPSQRTYPARLFFIAGTSRGIGIAVAVALVKAGASFIGLGARGSLVKAKEVLDTAKAAGEAVPTIAAVELDVTNTTSMDAAVEKIEKSFRRLDILINNAGWLELSVPIHSSIQIYSRRATKLTCEAFISPLELSYFHCSRHQDGCTRQILNLTSIGVHMLLPAMSVYNTAKLVTCRFTEYTAFEYADQDILAMAVHLGVRQVCGLVCQRSCTWVGKDLLPALGWGSNVLLTCLCNVGSN